MIVEINLFSASIIFLQSALRNKLSITSFIHRSTVSAGEFSWNQGILINISTITQEKKTLQKKFWTFTPRKTPNLRFKYRSSCPDVFCKKGVFRNFAKFTGTHLCQSLFLMKFTKETLAEVFSCEFCKSSKNILFYRKPPVVASVNRKFDPQIGNFS